jgi:hypothetical protein
VVLFVDSISKYNVSIPIVVRPYAAPVIPPSGTINRARPSGGGSIFAMHRNDATHYSLSHMHLCAVLLIACLLF